MRWSIAQRWPPNAVVVNVTISKGNHATNATLQPRSARRSPST
ncbi:hypothetical protein I552_0003 [Mycobacterium xenopi 3993]|nr:hypothetical protein I552_0003 [Mycobacterium xenopi 3993]